MDLRPSFYRIQQRLALTNREVRTLAVLLALMAAGLVIRMVRYNLVPYNPAYYDAYLDSLNTHTRTPPSDSATIHTAPPPSAAAPQRPPAGSIPINRATASELEHLPRIGPRTAERIVAFREANGPFRRVEDLLQIRGIGEKTLEGLRPHVVVD